MFDKLDLISNKKHDYLAGYFDNNNNNNNTTTNNNNNDNNDDNNDNNIMLRRQLTDSEVLIINGSNNNSEYEITVNKLSKIKSAQKFQIVIIGQRQIVKYILCRIRELETQHPAMMHLTSSTSNMGSLAFLGNFNDDSSTYLDRSATADTITLHTLKIGNIPPKGTREHLIDFFKQFGKVLDIELMKHDNRYNTRKQGDGELKQEIENACNDDDTRVAIIAFESKYCLENVLNKAESQQGLECDGYVLDVSQDDIKTIVELLEFIHIYVHMYVYYEIKRYGVCFTTSHSQKEEKRDT